MQTISHFRRNAALALGVFLGFGAVSSAATITSYDRVTFQAALLGGGVSSQNFDAIPAGTVIGTVNGVTYSASAGSALVTSNFLPTTFPNGLGSTSFGFFSPSETATFSFGTPISAFAIDVNTFAATAGAYRATLNSGDSVFSTFEVFPRSSTGQFFGFTSDTVFSSVTISAVTNFSYTLDTLVYGDARAVTAPAAVPEPATYGLIGSAALIGAVVLRRRAQR